LAYSAVLDANVLHPAVLSDLFLRLAEKDFFRPLWSAQIRSEAEGSILRVRPDVDPVRLKYRFDCMDAAFPDATVSGVETLTPVLTAEFGEDAHVVAAAIIGGADAIVTENMKDFPAEPTLKLHRIEAQRADEFLVNQWWLAPKVVCEVVVEMAADRKKPARTPAQMLEIVLKTAPEFATLVREGLAVYDASKHSGR